MSKAKSKLPNKIYNFKSSDKDWHQTFEDTTAKDLANFCSPYICLICNNKNCGKSRTGLNIVAHKQPPYEHIVVYSPIPDTKEYTEKIDCEMINDINDVYGKFNPEERNLFLLDDLDMKSLKKNDQKILCNFLRFECTHHQIDIIMINQSVYDLLPVARKIADYTILFGVNDQEFMRSLARRFDVELDLFKYIFKHYITEKTDSLLIDDKSPSHLRFRKNLFEIVKVK